MLGHHGHPLPAPQPEPLPAPEVDPEEARKLEELRAEVDSATLAAEGTAVERRAEIVTALRARLEVLLSRSTSTLLLQRAVLQDVIKALTRVPAACDAPIASPGNQFRTSVIELLGRLPVPEVPKQLVPEVMQACQSVLNEDHEDHGIVAQRLLFDIHKLYKQTLEDATAPFFDWLKTMYESLPAAAERQLAAAASSDPRPLVPARESLKIAPDIALMMFFLMQSYPRRLAEYGPALIPLMVAVVTLRGLEREEVPPAAAGIHSDFRMAQIKTMAFLIVVSRSTHIQPLLQPYRDAVAGALLRIMQTVPDILSVRKEVLGCMRNMLNTFFRPGLLANMDLLLDERVLLGTNPVCIEALRQMAFMHLAELVAATKAELTLPQLRRVVQLYTRNAVDPSNPLQVTSLRLLYNIIEVFFSRRGQDPVSSEAYRDLLSSVLDCMVAKLATLRDLAPRYICEIKELDEGRRQRKVAEAAAATAADVAGKRVLRARRAAMKDEARQQQKQETAAAAAAMAAAASRAEGGQDGPNGKAAVPTAADAAQQAAQQAAPPAVDQPSAAPGAQSVSGEAPGNGPAATAPPAADAATGADAMEQDAKPRATPAEAADADPDDEDMEESAADGSQVPDPFRILLHTTSSTSSRERDVYDYRNQLHSVLNCLKNVLFTALHYHTNRGIPAGQMAFQLRPWTSRLADVRAMSHILTYGVPAISFYQHIPLHPGLDARELLADLFTTVGDGRDFADVFGPRLPFLYETILANRWYMRLLRHLVEGDAATRTFVNRHAIACILRFLVNEKLDTLDDITSDEGRLTVEMLEMCFEALPRIQALDIQKGPQLAQHATPTVERAALPHLVAFLRASYPRLATGGAAAPGYSRAMRSLFYALATNGKFGEVQAAVGASGLHARIVDTALGIMQGPAARTREAEEAAAELCLLVPARLEHLIPVLPRMMHAAVRALNGSDRSVHIALRVLDVWVDSFNPEFIERSMAAVIQPLMAALWNHIRPPPHPFGSKVAEMLGKMGGRSRRWLGEGASVDFKSIPEYGLRVILAFPPHTSFLVPLDRCVQLAWGTVENANNDLHRRKNSLRLLQICVSTLSRLTLPDDMLKSNPPPKPTVPAAAEPSGAPEAALKEEGGLVPAAPPAPTSGGGEAKGAEHGTKPPPALADNALGRLEALLFGGGKPPEIPKELYWPAELGVKTKKQHAAEKQMLETVLTALMASAAVDAELEGAGAKDFAHATCRHFALLFAAGWAATATAPPAPPSSRVLKYGAKGGIPAYVAALKHLQPHVLLDAFQQGLQQSSAAARDSVVECMGVFLDTLVEVGEVQLQEDRKRKEAAAAETPASEEGAQGQAAEQAATAATSGAGSGKSSLSETIPYLNVQQDLIMRAMHCCYGDNWPSRLGGVAALEALAKRMPQRWLIRAANYIAKALMAVLRSLPDSATQEQQEVTNILLNIVRRALELPVASEASGRPGSADTPASAPQAGDGGDAMEVEAEEESAAQTGRRGKRSKRGGQQPARKRQQRSSPAQEDPLPEEPPGTSRADNAGGADAAPSGDDATSEGKRRLQSDLLQTVISSKSNDAVRAAATQCLQLLALSAGTSVGTMLGQMLSSRYGSLLERRMIPLKSIAAQTNYAHSTAFLLRTCPDQLPLTPSLATFVVDTCTLMELDDNAVASNASSAVRGQPPKADVMGKLRIACMEVLVAALNWPAFREEGGMDVTQHHWNAPGEAVMPIQQLRERIVKVFMRQLGSSQDRVVALATEGVQVTVAHNLLEKPVLQDGLRPILMDLAVYQRMTVHLLRHVHRLLDLLRGQFNVTLGQKLTEHLEKWIEVDKYIYPHPPQPVAWEFGTEWEVAASMLDIFHKLPPAAKQFLETHEGRPGIVVLTIGLEEALHQLPGAVVPSKMWSPYRAPLTRFLNRYPHESVAYFLDPAHRLSKPEYFTRLLDIIRDPLGRPLLDALAASADKMIAVLNSNAGDAAIQEAHLNCVHLIRAMCKLKPSWLPRKLYEVLLARWRSPERLTRLAQEVGQPRNHRMESKRIARALVNFVRRHHAEYTVLFDLLSIFNSNTAVDFSFLKAFLSVEAPREFSMEEKRAVLGHWISLFKSGTLPDDTSVSALRHLVNPTVLWAVTHAQQDMFTPDIVSALLADVFRSSGTACPSEQLQVEIIQLCTAVLQHAHPLFMEHKKELIQYIWWTLKQDNTAKAYAFLCVAQFFRAFPDTGEPVMLKAFVNMVRMAPPDASAREAVRQAIDIMVPILAEMESANVGAVATEPDTAAGIVSMASLPGDLTSMFALVGSGQKRPGYAAHLKKVVMEEGYNSSTLVVILQMVVRNREHVYNSRAIFIPIMINSLNRLGLPGQVQLESRVLAVDMASTLYWWDCQAAKEPNQARSDGGPQPMDVDAAAAEEVQPASDVARLTAATDDSVMNFLLRMAFVSCEVRDRDESGWRKLHSHCLDVLKDAARFRPPTSLKLNFFDRLLQTSMTQQPQHQAQQGHPVPDASAALVTGIRVINIFLEFQPDNVVVCCPNQIAQMIEPALYSKHRSPVELLAASVKLLFSMFPSGRGRYASEAASTAAKIQARVCELLTKYLLYIADPPNGQFHAEFFWYACNCVTVMRAAMQASPVCMQAVMGGLLKAMHRVAKDHNQQPQLALLAAKAVAPREVPTDAEYSTGAWFMYHALNVAVPSALILSAEHRKLFLSTLVMLITGQSVRQGQTDPAIMFTVMELMRGWTLTPKDKQQAHLTYKELLVLLQRLAQVDRLQAMPPALKPSWDVKFLDLLYTVITTKLEDKFGDDVFLRVERTFCCGLQSNDPTTRQKFFQLYTDRIQRDLFDRLKYIIQQQDWDFLAHTFWLKHAVAILFDCLHMRDSITLAYNSAHVPPLFNYKESLAFPSALQQNAGVARQLDQRGITGAGAGSDGAAQIKQEPAAAARQDALGEPSARTSEPGGGDVPMQDVPVGPFPARTGGAGDLPHISAGSTGTRTTNSSKLPHPVLDLPLPDALRTRLVDHLNFLSRQSTLRSDALVTCLIEQVQTDPMVAHHLWVLLFPIVWTSLQKEQQTGLAKPIIQLLSKEHHLRQALLRPTVGQTLLEGISMSQPQPKIPAEMIKYMGRHFHAWHTAISMLESHVGLFPQDMRCFDAVCDLYTALGEDDMMCGLWQRRAAADETRMAVALQQHGFLPEAQALYLEMMSRGVSGGVSGMTKSEMVLWHNQYLSTCMELNQWDTVTEYAKSTDNSALQLEAAAKQHDWAHLKQMVLPKAQVEEGPEFTMVKAQLQLQEMPIMEVDKVCKAAMAQCVLKWWQMPEASPWSYAPVLHSFQRAVELAESWRIMKEFAVQGGVGAQYQDLKDICDTWKLRTPNEWEPVRWWSDVLTWRNQVYNMTIRQFSNLQAAAPTLHQMGYRDKAWSVNRLGHVARRHNLPEACVHIINTLYGFNAMEVQEAFVKVHEQAKAYMLRPSEHLHGLNLINSTNMDYFQPPHQAEMICLKAQFLHLLNDPEAAHQTYSEALTLCPLCPDAWVNWGRFCDDRYATTKQLTWLEFAGACYTQGIRLSGPEARSLVPRLLHLLMLDPHGAEVVGRTLSQQAGDLPAWVWLPWVPQLITSLQRPETAAARRILVTVAAQSPQYVYWHVRPAVPQLKEAAIKAVNWAKDAAKAKEQQAAAAAVENEFKAALAPSVTPAGADEEQGVRRGRQKEQAKDVEAGGIATGGTSDASAAAANAPPTTAAAAPAASPAGERSASPRIEKPMEVIAYDNIKEVLEALKTKQTAALQSLEVMITELGSRFSSRTEERLLAVVYTLQQRTYKTPLPASAPVPESFKRELAGVCKACVNKDAAGSSGAWANMARYATEFSRDLDPASESAPQTLGELTERLKGWRMMLEAVIEDTQPATVKMEDTAPTLMEMSLEEVEMPCQPPHCPDGPDPVYVERIGCDVEIVRRACTASRRIVFYGSDGQARHFLMVQQNSAPNQNEDRVNQLLRSINALLASHPESRRRGLRFNAPHGIAIYTGVRIVEDDPSATPYIDAWETHCARYGREPDAPVVAFKARTCVLGPDGAPTVADPATRKAAYEEVCNKYVTENVFSQYMYKTMVENSRVMWTFKKQFSLSVALSAVACYMLKLTGRAPHKILVSKARGELTQLELTSLYNDRLQLDIGNETVPFRLTRNMSAFVGPHGFEGTLIAAAVAAVQGLQQDRTHLPSLLALFLRDDILMFAQRRLTQRCIASLRLPATQVENAIMYNVNQCLMRLERMGPRNGATVAVGGQPGAAMPNPQAGMRELMLVATSAVQLCQMEPTYQPWL